MRKLPQFVLPKRRVTLFYPDVGKMHGRIRRTVKLRQKTSKKGKYFVLQEIEFDHIRPKIQFRIGYYVIGKKKRMKSKWTWGQFAPLFPRSDLLKLIRKARKKGLID